MVQYGITKRSWVDNNIQCTIVNSKMKYCTIFSIEIKCDQDDLGFSDTKAL